MDEDVGVNSYPNADTTAHVATQPLQSGDARSLPLPDDSVDLIVTSPPYFQKRDYGFDEQIGQEPSVRGFVDELLECVEECKRVLTPHGSLFVNIGDTYVDRSLRGVPWEFARAVADQGWKIRNDIIWSKTSGVPEPADSRLANRHEYIFHFTRDTDNYYDQHGFKQSYGMESTPGDVWTFGHDRNANSHLAPFPEALVERCIRLAAPPAVCTDCGEPRRRQLAHTDQLNPERPQAARAMELYEQSDLTEDHIRAIQATGITDVGKVASIQTGTGKNRDSVEELATEAKEVLGSYFREFTQAEKETTGWSDCGCDAGFRRGVVCDPFCGTGTTVEVAQRMGFDAVGVDIDPPKDIQMSLGAALSRSHSE